MAIKYKLVKNSEGRDACINKAEDGVNFNTSIPYDSDNVDYQAYVEWAKTNTTEAADLTDWDIVRAKRDRLLVASDWTVITGATVDQAQWAAYRDKLRAIPQTYKDVADPLKDVVWPTVPSTKGPNTD